VRSRLKAFTLVELLVVIGIIALLISILIPALNKARKGAMSVQCLSNLRSIGQAIMQYSIANRGSVMPTTFNTGGAGGKFDYWVTILTAQKYLPDPGISDSAWNATEAAGRSVTVCPAVRTTLIYLQDTEMFPNLPGMADGFERDESVILADKNSFKTPHLHGLITEVGYGLNGLKDPAVVSGSIDLNFGDAVSNTAVLDNGVVPTWPVKKMNQFKQPSQTVMVFDGAHWNAMNHNSAYACARVSGGRHGNFDPKRPYDTGTCNLLFMDGHAVGVPRSSLPTKNQPLPGNAPNSSYEFCGPRIYMRDPNIIWSVDQQ
jgi:prepilin-type N-terminal cleavage/methylation domain-containing protein/prepilin-type processing-associated H-X9-DG protein